MRSGILIGFVLILAVLAGNGVFAIVNIRGLVEIEQRVIDTHVVVGPQGTAAQAEVQSIFAAMAAARAGTWHALVVFAVATALALGALVWEFFAVRREFRR